MWPLVNSSAENLFLKAYRTMHDPIALIALELDRTLFRSDTTVSDRTLGAIDACRNQGLHIAIATARPFASVQRLLPASLHRDVPWICGSGGSVYENAVCLYQDLIDVDTAQAVVEVLYRADEDFMVALEMAGRLYVNRPVEGLLPALCCHLSSLPHPTMQSAPAPFLSH